MTKLICSYFLKETEINIPTSATITSENNSNNLVNDLNACTDDVNTEDNVDKMQKNRPQSMLTF